MSNCEIQQNGHDLRTQASGLITDANCCSDTDLEYLMNKQNMGEKSEMAIDTRTPHVSNNVIKTTNLAGKNTAITV